MSRLVEIIDAYKDRHGGPSDSSIARAIGVKPQTLSSWRTRGIREPPSREALEALAQLAHLDYEGVVLRAALIDSGLVDDPDSPAGSDRDNVVDFAQPGPFDEDLDALPDERDDPQPVRGRSLPAAARREDQKP